MRIIEITPIDEAHLRTLINDEIERLKTSLRETHYEHMKLPLGKVTHAKTLRQAMNLLDMRINRLKELRAKVCPSTRKILGS